MLWKGNMADEAWGRGKGIRIAHIDSGINEGHSHIGCVAGGVAFHVSEEGQLFLSDAYQDELGHGTAVAGVLYEQVPEADIWAVKIFHSTLSTHIEILCAAIEWCIDARIHIINLSLGVSRDVPELRSVCEEADRKGVIIVSACDETRQLYWPAYYPTVYGAKAGEHCNGQVFYFHTEEPAGFRALGFPRRLEGPLQKFNLQGSSFAAAHITGFLAKIIEKYKVYTARDVREVIRTSVLEVEQRTMNNV
ncbi:S8 family serine peptidase [Aneurinibacillus aneurinilyticus]|uniref:S8 family serine peptidase n=1 Tax=Aneurinibacillus aneurinilyticus TaxID=1391 RepID=UPI0023F10A75|nr:S8 family serine peptidase [Aneurinibacillus aneurinilyticus]MED0668772.1 S8 family serine peptidase [Aneurinibacillus aneurinilyticus]